MTSQVLSPQASRVLTAWVRLLRAHASLTRTLNAQLHADHELTLNDYEALLHLARGAGCGMRRVDLAGELLLTPSGITRLLDGLEQSGLVEKGACESDARVSYAVITDAGRTKLEQASAGHVAALTELIGERFEEEELEALAELLGRLPDATGEGEECSAGAA
jgi:DNA-binding MarR family transcriptional regulator